ncbi:hypothetical protein FSHL1_006883 [Fusarium sambucinum]
MYNMKVLKIDNTLGDPSTASKVAWEKSDQAINLAAKGDTGSLRLAIAIVQQALDILSINKLYSTAIRGNLLKFIDKLYLCTKDEADLEPGIRAGNNFPWDSDLKDIDPQELAENGLRSFHSTLAFLYRQRYESRGETRDLASAISHMSRAAIIPIEPCNIGYGHYSNIGQWKTEMYEKSHDIEDLNYAIRAFVEARLLVPPDSEFRAYASVELARALQQRFIITKEGASLDDSIQAMQDTVAAMPENDIDLSQVLANLACCLEGRFSYFDKSEDLDEMIRALQAAVLIVQTRQEGRLCPLLVSEQHNEDEQSIHSRAPTEDDEVSNGELVPEAPYLMLRLAGLLTKRWRRRSSPIDLNRSIGLLAIASGLCEAHDRMRSVVLREYSSSLARRFDLLGDIEDLSLIIDVRQQWQELLQESHPLRLPIMMELARNLLERYNRCGNPEDVAKAQKLSEKVLNEADPAHPEMYGWLETSGCIQEARFIITRDPQMIDEAVRLAYKALDLAQKVQDPIFDQLFCLGELLGRSFRCTGKIGHLNKGIEIMEDSIKATTERHQQKASKMKCSLGWWLNVRFDRTGDMRDLNLGIQLSEEGIAILEDAMNLFNLYHCYRHRYEKSADPKDLDKSIEVLQRWPNDKKDRMAVFMKIALANALCQRGKDRKAKGDIDESIAMLGKVLETLPEHGRDRFQCVYGLAEALQTRYLTFGQQTFPRSFSDVDASIQYLERMREEPDGTDMDSLVLYQLGVCHKIRFIGSEFPEQSDNEISLSYFIKCFNERSSPILGRIEAADQASRILDVLSRPGEAAELLGKAIDLLSALNLRSLSAVDQQQVLQRTSGIASMAAAMLLNSSSDCQGALALLERGRGIMFGLLTETRMDMSILGPDLASELLDARQTVSSLQSASKPSPMADMTHNSNTTPLPRVDVRARHEAEDRLMAIIQRIQDNPKTQEFLQPPSLDELMSVLGDDNIVVVNASKARCDAFLINKRDGLKLVELTNLKLEDITQQVQRLRSSRPSISLSLLEWLWDDIASPILEGLGIHKACKDRTPPRLFWVTTGPLTQLPIHASGLHTRGSKETVLDRVISSYCSSLRSFVYARKSNANISNSCREPTVGQALLVSMEVTPNQKDLPFATKEIEVVERACSLLHLEPLRLVEPTREAVLEQLGSYIFHYAGHGRSDPHDPSQSGILLRDAVLTVADIREHNTGDRKPFLGYLQACLTAANDVPELADESIHLLTACQLAGFRHLIGSLWQLYDDDCVKMAETVYHNLASRGMTDHSVCAALHDACVQFRDEWVTRTFPVATTSAVETDSGGGTGDNGKVLQDEESYKPDVRLEWVPYVHYGP